MRDTMRLSRWLSILLLMTGPVSAAELQPTPLDPPEGTLQIAEDESVFAIVTHKAGFASGKAHNHFIAAAGYAARLEAAEGAVDGVVFEIELAAEELLVDSFDLQQAWYPRLAALGILDEPFGEELSEKNRDRIRGSMLGDKQLAAERFPEITARVVEIAEEASTMGEVEMAYRVTLAFEVRGKTVERPVAATASWDDGKLRVEAAGAFRFTDFGITPYSAFLGAVKNTDEFHVYVSLTASLPP